VATAQQPVPADGEGSILLEARRGHLVVAITLRYALIRELRALVKSPEEGATGPLFGRYMSDFATIERCAPGSRLQPPIGLFRTQAGGSPALTKTDCKQIQGAIPATAPGALFLIVRTLADRPWSATLFTLDPRQPSTAEAPLLEFPFDEDLLRNGWQADLTPPPATQPQLAASPRPRAAARWIAFAAAAALIGGGAAAYRFRSGLPEWNVGPEASTRTVSAAVAIGLNAARGVDDLEVSWNRGAQPVRNAIGGTLTIRNGPVNRTVPLSGQQLREGRILYHLLAGADADFRLELTMPGGKTAAESLQVLAFDNSRPLTVAAATPQRVNAARPAAPNAARRQAADRRKPAVSAAPSEPVPIRRANPVLTPQVLEEAQSAESNVKISVLVRIDAAGKVDTAKVVSSTGEPSYSRSYMRLASLNAARQWKFRPATAAGKPIPSESTLIFSF
jgi:hypothetical protein